MSDLESELRNIGFYACVKLGERSLHVQTEVSGKKEMVVRTTVIENGEVLDATTETLSQNVHDVAHGKELIYAQHLRVLTQVQSGKFS
jgi:hypothetical protein